MNYDLTERSPQSLLKLYSAILNEFKQRGIVRSFNAITGDYTEWLVAEKLGLTLEKNCNEGYDASCSSIYYQIKGRRGSGTLGVIRNIDDHEFTYLIAVIFDEYFNVKSAYQIPYEDVYACSKYNKHQHGNILSLTQKLSMKFDQKGFNITSKLKC